MLVSKCSVQRYMGRSGSRQQEKEGEGQKFRAFCTHSIPDSKKKAWQPTGGEGMTLTSQQAQLSFSSPAFQAPDFTHLKGNPFTLPNEIAISAVLLHTKKGLHAGTTPYTPEHHSKKSNRAVEHILLVTQHTTHFMVCKLRGPAV